MRRSRLSVAAVLLALLFPFAAGAQTTGSISGRVSDEQQGVLPGVTVEARSPALQGSRSTTTDATGAFRLPLLPPGEYTLTLSLAGFATETREAVAVGLDRELTLNVILQPATAETITVTGDVPVIDSSTTSLGTNLDLRAIETLPAGRNYASLVQIAPGTSSDANPENRNQTSITVYGSTGAENSFYIDGVNTTGVEYGFQGKELNFEFIQAIDVKTGGYEAEYGKSTGGIVNVITKSGGNELHGDVFGYYDGDSVQKDADSVVATSGTVEGFTREDYGFGVGGYFVPDKLWFFAAYDLVKNDADSRLAAGPREGEVATSESERDLASLKLTYNLRPGQSLVGSFFQDPREDTGAINDAAHSLNGDPSTYTGKQELGGRDFALRYEGIFGSNWLLTAQAARHEEENSVGPATAAGDVVQFRTVAEDFFQRGGFGLIQTKEFERDFYGATLTRFASTHELKGGLEFEQQDATVTKRMSGGQQVDIFENAVDPSRPIFRHFFWTTVDATLDNAPVSSLLASPSHENVTAFLQDKWAVRSNLTLSYGLRWDRQQIFDASGTKQIDLKDDYAPRLGFIWDPAANGTSKLYGSYGRFYEQLPMDLVIRSFSFERQPRIVNYSPTSTTPDPRAEADFGTSSAILGGFTEPSDPNLENQYITELLLGYERQVMPDVAVGIKGIYRTFDQVIEDFLCADDGTYCIGNPGEGIMRSGFNLDYTPSRAYPKPEREFKGVELSATKRFSNGWQGLASYLYSKLDGNFDGLYAPFTNIGPDPNITAAYDYFDFFTDGRDLSRITNEGPLSNDRRHQLKVSGVYLTPWKLSLGVAAYWRSGTPVTRYGFSDAYGRYEFFLSKRGAEGRTPSNYEADVHLGYPLEIGRAKLNILVDVFNLLDAQRAILVDQRYGFQEADNFSPTPVNPGYKKPVLRTSPTTVRLGVRVSF